MSTPEIDHVALLLYDAAGVVCGHWADAPDSVKAFYRRLARAAIAALRSETT